jgi:hypothetical protein
MAIRFDWLAFVEAQRIDFVERGANVARGHINIQCPFCGGSDPSHHMGLSLDIHNPAWGCFRDNKHRGRNPAFLIMRLLHCSGEKADEIIAASVQTFADDLDSALERLRGRKELIVDGRDDKQSSLRFPSSIKPIDGGGYSGRFLDYIEARGFKHPYVAVDTGELRYAVAGDFAWRLIFPIYLKGKLVTYTGRDITGRAEIRYKTLPRPDEIVNIKDLLYCEDMVAKGGNVLFATEGPLDALKFNAYLPPGSLATCFFGMPSTAQVMKLMAYASRWDHLCVLLDPEAATQSLALHYAFHGKARLSTTTLPQGAKDPAECTPTDVRKINHSVLHSRKSRAI